MPARSFGYVRRSTGPTRPHLDDDYYEAQLAGVFDDDRPYNGEPRMQYRLDWRFKDADANGNPIAMPSWVNVPPSLVDGFGLSDISKLYDLIVALGLLPEDPMEPIQVEPEEWLGRWARVRIENKLAQGGEGEMVSKIVGYKPLVKRNVAPPAPAPARSPAPLRERMAAPVPQQAAPVKLAAPIPPWISALRETVEGWGMKLSDLAAGPWMSAVPAWGTIGPVEAPVSPGRLAKWAEKYAPQGAPYEAMCAWINAWPPPDAAPPADDDGWNTGDE